MSNEPQGITRGELDAETGTALPAKEVISLLDTTTDDEAAAEPEPSPSASPEAEPTEQASPASTP